MSCDDVAERAKRAVERMLKFPSPARGSFPCNRKYQKFLDKRLVNLEPHDKREVTE